MQIYAATEQVRDEYKQVAAAGMVRLAKVSGVMFIVSKIFWLVVIALWMTAILITAAQCAAQAVVSVLLALRSSLFGGFCVPHILAVASKNSQPQGLYAGHCQSDRGRQGMTWHSYTSCVGHVRLYEVLPLAAQNRPRQGPR